MPRIVHEISANDFPEDLNDDMYQEAVEDYYRHYDSADGDFGWRVDLKSLDQTQPWVQWMMANLPANVIEINKLGIKFYQ